MKKALKIISILLGILVVLIVGFLALVYIPSPKFEPVAYEPITPKYWPTQGWRASTPEEQGMDSEKLVEMVAYYKEKQSKNKPVRIDSFTVIRNGYVVADLYFNPLFPRDATHILHSCTNSITVVVIAKMMRTGIENEENVTSY